MLIVKINPAGRDTDQEKQRDLDFVREHLERGWPDSLRVSEVNGGEIVSALRSGVDSLELLRRVLE